MRRTNLSVFKRDYIPATNQGLKISLLKNVAAALAIMGGQTPDKNKDRALTGSRKGHGGCLVLPDLLLIYRMGDDLLILPSTRIVTHIDLLRKS